MADKMAIKETNVTTVHTEDRDFIRALVALPAEKQILIKGIIIGLDLQGKPPGQARERMAAAEV